MIALANYKREIILRAVQQMYTEVARSPGKPFHFLVGRASGRLAGYPEAELDALPPAAVESFAGVAYPFAANAIRPGDTVLDVGSGSGTDVLIAARRAGPKGKVYALDMTAAMRAKLRANLAAAGIGNVEILAGEMEAIPLPAESVDVVTSNGVLNLAPDKGKAIAEIFRVLKPGGRLQLADIALGKSVSFKHRQDPELWAECIVGAIEEDKYLGMLRAAGFRDIEVLGHMDFFASSPSEDTRKIARAFDARALTLRASKPSGAELERTLAADTPGKRAFSRFARQSAGVAGAVFAGALCAGAPALVSAFTALGAGAFIQHAYTFPLFAALVGAAVWLLYRAARVRAYRAPFWVGLAGGAVAVASGWLALVGIFPFMAWWPNVALAALFGAGLWSFLNARRADSCLDEMIREAGLRAARPPLPRRIARGAALAVVAATALYGISKSIDVFMPPPAAAHAASR